MHAQEGEAVNLNKLDETKFTVGFWFSDDEDASILIKVGINDDKLVLRPEQAMGLALYIMQAVHRADTIRVATHTHLALTHNNSAKRRTEFISAVNQFIAREETNARADDRTD